MVTCRLCRKEFKSITPTHLKKAHSLTMAEYRARFPEAALRDVSEGQRVNYSKAAKAVWDDPKYKAKHAPRLAGMAQDANAALQEKREADPEFDAAWLEACQAAQEKNRKNFCQGCGKPVGRPTGRCRECWFAWRLEQALHPCENPDCGNPVKGRLKYCSPECMVSDPAYAEAKKRAGRISQEKHPENIDNLEPGGRADILTRPDVRKKQRLATIKRHKGVPKSTEHRRKISAGQVRHWRTLGVTGKAQKRPLNWGLISERIRLRDKHCLICKRTESYRELSVHHINGNWQDNRDVNFATLCSRCHGKVTQQGNIWRPWPLPEELLDNDRSSSG